MWVATGMPWCRRSGLIYRGLLGMPKDGGLSAAAAVTVALADESAAIRHALLKPVSLRGRAARPVARVGPRPQ
jgi:hypothetical protein